MKKNTEKVNIKILSREEDVIKKAIQEIEMSIAADIEQSKRSKIAADIQLPAFKEALSKLKK